jgi:hypothetical protein
MRYVLMVQLRKSTVNDRRWMSDSSDQQMPEPVRGVGAEGSDTERRRYLGADGRLDLHAGCPVFDVPETQDGCEQADEPT